MKIVFSKNEIVKSKEMVVRVMNQAIEHFPEEKEEILEAIDQMEKDILKDSETLFRATETPYYTIKFLGEEITIEFNKDYTNYMMGKAEEMYVSSLPIVKHLYAIVKLMTPVKEWFEKMQNELLNAHNNFYNNHKKGFNIAELSDDEDSACKDCDSDDCSFCINRSVELSDDIPF